MLILHRSARADLLVDALGSVLAEPLEDPITPEVVAVPTRGVERWISQRLSHRLGVGATGTGGSGAGATGTGGSGAGATGADGVCANLEFPFPGTVVTAAAAAATGFDADEDPWLPERAVWPLVELIDEHRDDPRLARLRRHLEAISPPAAGPAPSPPTGPAPPPADGSARRWMVARRIADLYDRYAVHRPGLLLGWRDGTVPDGGGPEPAGGGWDPADPGYGWQAHLWRLLRARLGVPGPAERLADAAGIIAARPEVLALPERLSVFGLTRLPESHLRVLDAVAAGRDVHLYLLHPSGALWDRLAGTPAGPRPRRADDPTRRAAANPLLRSWGRDAREMQLVLAGRGIDGGVEHPVPEPGRPSLLQRIQADIRADRDPATGLVTGGGRPELAPGDRSVQVHACHGRGRQVEVVRDAILHLLGEDPSLEPRDVIVMCPDIEEFAPLIQATFGARSVSDEPGDGGLPSLRVRLADRSLRQTNPLLGVAAGLIELAGSRMTASAVLDLAGRPPVSRRFRFDRDELSTIESWVAGAGIRWGLDAAHRAPWSLSATGANTWSAGLDRLLLGVAMAERECGMYAGVLPFDDMPSGSVDLAGRFAEFVDRLAAAVDALSGPQPVSEWARALVEATESVAVSERDEEWQLEELRRTMGEVAASPAGAVDGPGPHLSLEEARSLLAGRLEGRPTRANFRTGDLTVCTLVPMRAVPHRVVVLLGLDDGAFPRHSRLDGDDLLLADPLVGDRDPRSEDRQLLLDALLAAGDHLVVTYSGRDERSNRPRPPCAPVAELLDAVDATVGGPDGAPARGRIVVHHPLQPFDPRNFRPGALAGPGPWAFDPVQLRGAVALGRQRPPQPWLGEALSPLAEPVVQLDDLLALLSHPARAFLRRRLSLYLGRRGDDIEDAIPVDPDALQRWAVGDRLLEARLAGVPIDRALEAERARGMLPPGPAAQPVLAALGSGVEQLVAVMDAMGFGSGRASSRETRVDLPGGRTLIGTVPGLRGEWLVQCNWSRLSAKHRLAAWVRLLALLADRPDEVQGAVSAGRAPGGRSAVRAVVLTPPVPADQRRSWAVERLGDLVALYDDGLTHPLPVPCATAHTWAAGRRAGAPEDELLTRAAQDWDGGRFDGERDDPEHVRIHGRRAPLGVLMGDRPRPGDGPDDVMVTERTRFGVLARRLWDPILDCEQVRDS